MAYSGWLVLKVPGIEAAGADVKAKQALMAVKGVAAVSAYPQQSAVGVAFGADGNITIVQLLTALKEAGFNASLYP